MQAQIDDNHQNLALHFNFRKIEPSENGQFHQILAPKGHFTVEDGSKCKNVGLGKVILKFQPWASAAWA
jgi:hypothetical protein